MAARDDSAIGCNAALHSEVTKTRNALNSNALDWPLTHNEKKSQILRLYNYDLRAADTEVERLRAAVESAAAVFRAIKPTQAAAEDDEPESDHEGMTPPRPSARSRSEGAEPKNVQPCKPALCRTPRGDRQPKKRVSFGNRGQPEEEPVRELMMTDDEDEAEVGSNSSKKPKRRDSIQVQKERSGTAASNDDTSDDEYPRADKHVGEFGHRTTSAYPTIIKEPVVVAAIQRPGMKAYLPWAVCAMVLAVFLKDKLISSEAPEPAQGPAALVSFGDPSCWTSGFRPEHCCLGDGGNPDCWDASHTYERCCLGRKSRR